MGMYVCLSARALACVSAILTRARARVCLHACVWMKAKNYPPIPVSVMSDFGFLFEIHKDSIRKRQVCVRLEISIWKMFYVIGCQSNDESEVRLLFQFWLVYMFNFMWCPIFLCHLEFFGKLMAKFHIHTYTQTGICVWYMSIFCIYMYIYLHIRVYVYPYMYVILIFYWTIMGMCICVCVRDYNYILV